MKGSTLPFKVRIKFVFQIVDHFMLFQMEQTEAMFKVFNFICNRRDRGPRKMNEYTGSEVFDHFAIVARDP